MGYAPSALTDKIAEPADDSVMKDKGPARVENFLVFGSETVRNKVRRKSRAVSTVGGSVPPLDI